MKGMLFLLLLIPVCCAAQLKQAHLEPDADNAIQSVSFITSTEGFVAFQKWIGYTRDGGRTFEKKYITNSNVNFNGMLPVNLTFGFYINGVHVFDNNRFLVYGHYGFVPAILLSTDRGNSYKLVYHATMSLSSDNNGIRQVVFAPGTQNGYAIEKDRFLRTTNNGETWTVQSQRLNAGFSHVSFPGANGGFLLVNGLTRTKDGGATWTPLVAAPGPISAMSFVNENMGWISVGDKVYKTTDAGTTWSLKTISGKGYSSQIKFVNDSVGYSIGQLFSVMRTSDEGKYWEPVTRDNNFSYLGYGHNSLSVLSAGIFWAGGGHGFLEKSENDPVPTVPVAAFSIDTSALGTMNKVSFLNAGKPGYNYRWYRNDDLIATSYNADYISGRMSIDTFRLVVTNGSDSASFSEVIDLRSDKTLCFADFIFVADTNSVSFTAGYRTAGVRHSWNFGDGTGDSNNLSPVHLFAKPGVYNITHTVFNPVDRCTSSKTMSVTIDRIQNCLRPLITMTPDSFYPDRFTYYGKYDSSTQLNNANVHRFTWDFGNGNTSPLMTGDMKFSSAGTYNVCLTIKNGTTGCVSTVCQPVTIKLDSACNGDFRVETWGKTIQLSAKPAAVKQGKRHTWKFIQGTTPVRVVSSGNDEVFEYSLFTRHRDPNGDFEPVWGSVGQHCDNIIELPIDSLPDMIRHIVYDSTSGCSDSSETAYSVVRRVKVFIRAEVDPNFSQRVVFSAYTIQGGQEWAYPGTWRVVGPGSTYLSKGYAGNNSSIYYTFPYAYRFQVSIGTQYCQNNEREVYTMNIDIKGEACPVYPPKITFIQDPNNSDSISFSQAMETVNSALDNKFVWYFGDGDSSKLHSPGHRYRKPGTYKVILRYTNKNGCYKEDVQIIAIGLNCGIKTSFVLDRDAAAPASINFRNLTTADTTIQNYKWYFGNSDTSSLKNPSYQYTVAGSYKVRLVSTAYAGCSSVYDTTIIITASDLGVITPPAACSVNAAYRINGNFKTGALLTFTNLSHANSGVVVSRWYFGNGDSSLLADPSYQYRIAGTYRVSLIASNGPNCVSRYDSTIVITDSLVANPPVTNPPVVNPTACDLQPGFTYTVAGKTVNFVTASSGLRSGDKVLWSFGDGDTSSVIQPIHAYKSEGKYLICLRIARDANCTREYCDTVELSMPRPESVTIFPNPVTNWLTVTLNTMSPAPTTIRIFNQQGRLVSQQPYQASTGTNQVRLDVSGLRSGVYMVMVTGYLTNMTQRFIKL